MKKLTVIFLLLASPLVAEPDLTLPDMVLQVEELKINDLPEVISTEEKLPDPGIEIPLPQSPVTDLPASAFRLVLDPSLGADVSPGSREAPFTVYSRGSIGAGSMNYLLGSISLFKIGKDPRFSLSFFHEGMDGYWNGSSFKDPGSYAFNRQDQLDLTLVNEDKKGLFDLKTGYREEENGLQQRSIAGFQTVLLRTIGVSMVNTWKEVLSGKLELQAKGDYAAQVLSSPTPVSTQEWKASFDGALSWAWGEDLSLKLGLGTWTDGVWSAYPGIPLEKNLGGRGLIQSRWTFLPGWEVEGLFTPSYDSQTAVQLPGKADLRIMALRGWIFNLNAGWKSSVISFKDLWTQLPVRSFAGMDRTRPERGWFLGMETQTQFEDSLSLKIHGSFESVTDKVMENQRDLQLGLLTLGPQSGELVNAGITLLWKLAPGWETTGGWTGSWGLISPILDSHKADLMISWTGDAWGAAMTGLWTFNPGTTVWPPKADLSLFFKPWEGIKVTFDALDIPSLFLGHGREVWGGFLAPGFLCRVVTHISL